MSLLELIPAAWRPWAVALALALVAGLGAAGAWTVQAWRYETRLAEQAKDVARDAEKRAQDVLTYLNDAQRKRQALEARLQANDEAHSKELSHVQQSQKILSSRLATSELRLSVILASPGIGPGGSGVSAAPGSGGVVHAGTRAELDPAHAQRIVAITGDGDEGLTALAACQGYVKEIVKAGQSR